MKMNRSKKILLYIALLGVAFLVIFPIVWAVSASMRTDDELFAYMSPATWRTFFPVKPTLEAYRRLFSEFQFSYALGNTLIVCVATMLLGCIVNSIAAFAFARFHFRFQNFLYSLIVVSFMVPFDTIAFPLYQIVYKMGLRNTYSGMVLPCIANGLVLFLFVQFFKDIPTEIIEAARVDGASWLRVFVNVIMPLSIPVFITAGLVIFISQWNSYLWPLLMAQTPDMQLIQIRLAQFKTEEQILWSCIYAASVLSAFIPVALFLPFQKYYIEGITSGGVKG